MSRDIPAALLNALSGSEIEPSYAVEFMFEPFRATVTVPAPEFLMNTTLPALGLAGSVIVRALAEFTIS